jgi:hypothetical protein
MDGNERLSWGAIGSHLRCEDSGGREVRRRWRRGTSTSRYSSSDRRRQPRVRRLTFHHGKLRTIVVLILPDQLRFRSFEFY